MVFFLSQEVHINIAGFDIYRLIENNINLQCYNIHTGTHIDKLNMLIQQMLFGRSQLIIYNLRKFNRKIEMIKRRNNSIKAKEQYTTINQQQSRQTVKSKQRYSYNLDQLLDNQQDQPEHVHTKNKRTTEYIDTFSSVDQESKPPISRHVGYKKQHQHQQNHYDIINNAAIRNRNQRGASKHQNQPYEQNQSFKQYKGMKQSTNHNISLPLNNTLNDSQCRYQPQDRRGGISHREHVLKQQLESDLDEKYQQIWRNNQPHRNKNNTYEQQNQGLDLRLKNIARQNTNKIINQRPSRQNSSYGIEKQELRFCQQPIVGFSRKLKSEVIQSNHRLVKRDTETISKDKSASQNRTKPTSPRRCQPPLNINSQITTLKSSPNRRIAITMMPHKTVVQLSEIDEFMQRLNSRMKIASRILEQIRATSK